MEYASQHSQALENANNMKAGLVEFVGQIQKRSGHAFWHF